MDLHVYVHFPHEREKTDLIVGMLRELLGKVNAMSAELDKLTASVTALTTVVDSAEALLAQFADMIRALPADRAAINKLADDVDAQSAQLAAAVAANTPTPPA